MKFSRLIFANLFRKKVRLLLTLGSFAVALFLFAFLAVVRDAFGRGADVAGADRLGAAPTSMATWVSWPHACMAPGFSDAKARPVSSCSGNASMSPRNSTVRPCDEPRSTATIPLVEGPVRYSRGRPVRAAMILAAVSGVRRPSSGSA